MAYLEEEKKYIKKRMPGHGTKPALDISVLQQQQQHCIQPGLANVPMGLHTHILH